MSKKNLYILTFTATGPEKADVGGVVAKMKEDSRALTQLRAAVRQTLWDLGWLNANPSWGVETPEVTECP